MDALPRILVVLCFALASSGQAGGATPPAVTAASATESLSAADQALLARTAEAHAHDVPVATPAATTAPAVPVRGRTVTYSSADGMTFTGHLVRPDQPPVAGSEPLPGLIVIHEWWGLNDNIRDEAGRLAGEGYVVLAVDLFGGQVATEPPAAMKLSQALTANPDPAEANLKAAYAYLASVEKAPRIGTIGWCLGGRWSLRTALLLPTEVDATVIFYGSVAADESELAALQMPVLGLFASKDRVIPVPTVTAFAEKMRRLGKDVDIRVYEGADHGFANPSGLAYEPAAAEDAWELTTAFLRQHLAGSSR